MRTNVPTISALRPKVRARVAVLLVAILVAIGALVGGVLWWSAAKADEASLDRQRQVVASVLENSVTEMALEQEGMTLKDTAVPFVDEPVYSKAKWGLMDRNFGTFLFRPF